MSIKPITKKEHEHYLRMAANAEVLPHEAYIEWDKTLVDIARQELHAFSDIVAAGLSKPLGSIGQTVAKWQRLSDMTPASVSMDGRASGERDRLTFDDQGVPVPVFHKEFTLSARNIAAVREGYESLETVHVRTAGRIVLQSVENMIVNGVALPGTVDGLSVYGYTNYTHRQTSTLAATWATYSEDRDIVGDVARMLDKAFLANFYGPFMLYIPNHYWAELQNDYSTEKGDKTFLERIKSFSGIQDVKPLQYLANDNVVLVQMTEEVVSGRVAQDLQSFIYDIKPLQISAMVSTIMTVQLKSDADGRCGIVHATLAG